MPVTTKLKDAATPRGMWRKLAARAYPIAGRALASVVLVLVYVFFRTACRGRVVGAENLTNFRESGYILAANHGSYLDFLVLEAYFRFVHGVRLAYFAKDRLFRHPFWGLLVSTANCIRTTDDATRLIDDSDYARFRFLVIFPEGKRTRTGRLTRAHDGVIKIAVKLGRPIIPVGMTGFYESWPYNRSFPVPARCTIMFGRACQLEFKVGSILGDGALEQEARKLMVQIADLIGQQYRH
jgi:1-acyl-sn-glycerol-3-phosphate acyltransferase